jgi:RNA-binding protein
MLTPLTNAEVRRLKAAAQRLKSMLKMGRQGLSPAFLQTVDESLKHHALIKIKFDEFKDQRKTLAPSLAEKTSSHLVTLVGNVAVLYRPKAETAKTAEDGPPG